MIFSKKNFTRLGILLTSLILSIALRSSALINNPNIDTEDALFIAESHNILKVALADGRVLFEIP